ncbi:hypothetical protein [Actinomycetospora straminea]|uniref:hypothetical protein n=1 Tax=Actinomycetospora straminea TaxID=663607 RepID=UPI0023654A1A|nr:hypothetical protein [Actinomycetospora straminea]MDD7936738.1 hypothetical protein [Actinomycetospora straminea]
MGAVAAVFLGTTFGVGGALDQPPQTDFYSTSAQVLAGILVALAIEFGNAMRSDPTQAQIVVTGYCGGMGLVCVLNGLTWSFAGLLDPGEPIPFQQIAGSVAGGITAVTIPFLYSFWAFPRRIRESLSDG